MDEDEVDFEDLSTFPVLLQKACQQYVERQAKTLNERMVQLIQYGLYCRS